MGTGRSYFFLKGPKNIVWSVQGPSWGALGGFWVDFGSFSGGAGEASGNVCGRRSAPRHGFNSLRVKSAAPAAGRLPKRDFVGTTFG